MFGEIFCNQSFSCFITKNPDLEKIWVGWGGSEVEGVGVCGVSPTYCSFHSPNPFTKLTISR